MYKGEVDPGQEVVFGRLDQRGLDAARIGRSANRSDQQHHICPTQDEAGPRVDIGRYPIEDDIVSPFDYLQPVDNRVEVRLAP